MTHSQERQLVIICGAVRSVVRLLCRFLYGGLSSRQLQARSQRGCARPLARWMAMDEVERTEWSKECGEEAGRGALLLARLSCLMMFTASSSMPSVLEACEKG